MKRLQNYTQFLNETVYLFKTIFSSYEFVVDNISENGEFTVGIEDEVYKVPVQLYGLKEDKEFIFRQPSELSKLEEGGALFEAIISDIIYILNKNQLGFEFTLSDITKERGASSYHAIISTGEEMNISDLERIVTTTKIVNPKVKDTGDYDKMIYQTK